MENNISKKKMLTIVVFISIISSIIGGAVTFAVLGQSEDATGMTINHSEPRVTYNQNCEYVEGCTVRVEVKRAGLAKRIIVESSDGRTAKMFRMNDVASFLNLEKGSEVTTYAIIDEEKVKISSHKVQSNSG